ncbi:MAG TPA: hypothetical protein VKV80_16320 [Streptosporangiaceae bacterium]|jgi:hypothetical protein|nr:hypothetical protein [Streptosporangiaceae bacterium]
MTGLLRRLTALVRTEPAALTVTVPGLAAAAVITLARLDHVQAGYLAALVTAAGTAATGFLARPVNVTVISGAAGTMLESLALFGLHLSTAQVAVAVAAVSAVTGHLMIRPNVTPKARMYL